MFRQDLNMNYPELLGFYVSQPANTEFEVEVLGGKDHSNAEQITDHIKLMTRMALSRDGRLAITYDISPRIEEYLASNSFSLD